MQTVESQPVVLAERDWRTRQAAHRARMSALTREHDARAERGEKHPVHDFLFTYYSFKPAVLKRWHPGIGVVLTGDAAREFLGSQCYSRVDGGVMADPASFSEVRRAGVTWMLGLLRATAARPAAFGCHGLHEWAMVYKQAQEDLRHPDFPLRFAPEEIDRIVEASTVRCTHFDAFRFFTEEARPLNRVQPERSSIHALEQRGCLHANMDLFKWAAKLLPFAPSELVADAFELARDIRETDMRASPYDLRALGYAPIAIETPEGRVEYERQQRAFAARGEPIRARLTAVCEAMIAAWRSG
ncbi:MAG TPA: 3-methyladenine DNA glycosylase [Opitutaceae bacterium]|nr:3-methyladenine DNA glycosylase [Opitutaceae bacterium]